MKFTAGPQASCGHWFSAKITAQYKRQAVFSFEEQCHYSHSQTSACTAVYLLHCRNIFSKDESLYCRVRQMSLTIYTGFAVYQSAHYNSTF